MIRKFLAILKYFTRTYLPQVGRSHTFKICNKILFYFNQIFILIKSNLCNTGIFIMHANHPGSLLSFNKGLIQNLILKY